MRRSRKLAGEPTRLPTPVVDLFDSRPNGIRAPRSRPRHSRCLSGPGEIRAIGSLADGAIVGRETQPPAPPDAAPAPQAATPSHRPAASRTRVASFDHLVGTGEQRGGHLEA